MADAPVQFQPGDQVALLEGGPPMTVKAVNDDGRTVTCESSSEDKPSQQDYDATKLTKLTSGQELGAKS
ncbi:MULTISPECIES: hypothetical protein [Spirosoma]|uniref:Uncharacterized protein n=1 Tax=Spirosoma liriopis TaxID=2937440 RepID=A0ABT0HVQ7_9BACT|nr:MULTISPECIES: hypothetical protein [Spirosoma]MCK8495683.1 hypothetical protein [Spirosoma liriopis]UHG91377.1 hypothetical protein LQ777_00405 [Spirosoma oryzicola]